MSGVSQCGNRFKQVSGRIEPFPAQPMNGEAGVPIALNPIISWRRRQQPQLSSVAGLKRSESLLRVIADAYLDPAIRRLDEIDMLFLGRHMMAERRDQPSPHEALKDFRLGGEQRLR